MFNMVYDFLLIIIFFVVFKLYDIYIATGAIIVGSAIQVFGTRILKKHYEKKQIIILIMVLVFGGMTIYFHNPIFIKWKPTVLFWLGGVIFLVSHFIGEKSLAERMMSQALEGKKAVPKSIWRRLNMAWIIFFVCLGTVNLCVAYYFSTDTWVNFKVYGILGALMIFAFAQAFYLARYLVDEKS